MPERWGHQLDDIAADPTVQPAVDALLATAHSAAAEPIIRRVYRYEDVGRYRTWRDGRALPLEPEIQQLFALAMSDFRVEASVPIEIAQVRLPDYTRAAAPGEADPLHTCLVVRSREPVEALALKTRVTPAGHANRGAAVDGAGRQDTVIATGQLQLRGTTNHT